MDQGRMRRIAMIPNRFRKGVYGCDDPRRDGPAFIIRIDLTDRSLLVTLSFARSRELIAKV